MKEIIVEGNSLRLLIKEKPLNPRERNGFVDKRKRALEKSPETGFGVFRAQTFSVTF